MNQLSLVIVALVAFTYFGGSYVPSVLKSNKQMLLGVVGGLVLCSFFGVRLVEGSGRMSCSDTVACQLAGKGILAGNCDESKYAPACTW